MLKVEITLKNPLKPELPPVAVAARVDESIWEMRIPAELALQLGLQLAEKRNGVPYVGVQLEWKYKCYTGALVMGHEVVLGRREVIEMEENIKMKKVA